MVNRILTHENFVKIQLRIHKSEKRGTFFLKMKNVASDIQT